LPQNHVNVFYLTWIMSPHYLVKCKMLIVHAHWVVRVISSRSYSTLIARFESSWLQSVENIARDGVQSTHNLSGWTTTENGVGQAGSCHHCGSHSSIMSSIGPDQWCVFCTPPLAIFLHAVIKWIQIWQIWRPQLRWDKFWSYFLRQLSGTMCTIITSSFTR